MFFYCLNFFRVNSRNFLIEGTKKRFFFDEFFKEQLLRVGAWKFAELLKIHELINKFRRNCLKISPQKRVNFGSSCNKFKFTALKFTFSSSFLYQLAAHFTFIECYNLVSQKFSCNFFVPFFLEIRKESFLCCFNFQSAIHEIFFMDEFAHCYYYCVCWTGWFASGCGNWLVFFFLFWAGWG